MHSLQHNLRLVVCARALLCLLVGQLTRVVQALASAHLQHPQFDARSRSPAFHPEALLALNVLLPTRVRKPLRRAVEHLQNRIGTVALVQALPLRRIFSTDRSMLSAVV